MQKISDSTNTANAAGEFTEGSAAGGIPATLLRAAWLNAIQRELVAVIEDAGLSLDPNDDTQLRAAIRGLLQGKLNANATAVAATKLATARTIGGVAFDGTANINLPGVNAAGNQSTTGNAATATKLATARTLSISGAGSGNASFDGSANVNIALTLADSGVAAGTYPKVTINAKGLVTSGAALVAADIPSLDWSKINSGKPTTLAGYGITDGFRADWSASDYNELSASGLYRLGSGATANRPAGWSGSQALHLEYGSYAGTLALSLSDDEIAFRRRSPDGYSTWKSLAFRSSTLSGYGIADAYTKTETVNAINSGMADYGIGVQKISTEVNLNNYYVPGKYITPQVGLLNLPDGWAQGRHTVDVTGGAAYCVQIIAGGSVNKGRLAIRVYDGSNWITQELSPLGVGQTWQDFTGSRAWATTYTNTTGRPIQISITARDPSVGNLYMALWVGGVKLAEQYHGASVQAAVTAIVPPGATYKVERADNNDTITSWMELR